MTQNELLNKRIQTPHGPFRPIYKYTEELPIYDEEQNIIDWKLVDYIETMTAEEYYQKWLIDKENPPILQPNEMEVLEKKVAELEEEKELLTKENKLLHAQVEVLSNTTDFHEELITEMAMEVYA